VLELHALAEDFNALLAELQSQQQRIEARHRDLRRSNESLRHASLHDGLTGLPNRSHLFEHLHAVLEGGQRRGDRTALLFIDVERFKQVNDELGHAVGDALLVELARRLRGALRESDFVARHGGDEFLAVLSPLAEAAEADRCVQRIRAALAPPMRLDDGRELALGVSIGVALYPEQGGSADALIQAADAAMYRDKARRRRSPRHWPRPRVCPACPEPGARAARRPPKIRRQETPMALEAFRPAAACPCPLPAAACGLRQPAGPASPTGAGAATAAPAREAGLRALGFRPTEQGWELDLGGRVTFAVDDASLSEEALRPSTAWPAPCWAWASRAWPSRAMPTARAAPPCQRLSERRAQAVAQALVARGFAPDQVRHQGFGASRPIEDNRSELGRQQNRRVTLIVASL
jgi:diguanylate cyclase (GGDEF)-like protein